ncbi:hypothetical protein GWI33_017426 [Rhynchophorus ferrugineus]|uniref:Uncharacterized protein n=1 Tax=Rhynchophorus ferrugineus TaxID=354439 RepID=A0A834I9A9_RHYFE|nr:hypothetical protein GWI33_017426 [Rhynchophorus ferrugineus]
MSTEGGERNGRPKAESISVIMRILFVGDFDGCHIPLFCFNGLFGVGLDDILSTLQSIFVLPVSQASNLAA